MIGLHSIYKSFSGTEVIKGIDLEIKQGETMVLLGLSGSGKTTTLKLINGLILPDEGSITFNGKPLAESNLLEVRRKMGYVIQQGGLFPHYTVFENVAVVPRLLKWAEKIIQSRVKLLLEKLHLDPSEFSDKYPTQLSGGQQQRIGLARALAASPPVLLMDEPFGALDPITRQSVRKEFLELDELREKTVVLVTHDVQEAFELGDRIAIMHQGQIIQNDTPENILAHPSNEFVNEFIKAERLTLTLKNAKIYGRLNTALASGELTADDLKNLTHE